MTLKHTFKTAITGLKTHRLRSSLTILGIVIGIAAIITVMALGEGAQNLILSQIQNIGPKLIAVVPGRQPKGPTDIFSLFADSLKQRDLELISRKSNVPHADKIMPVVFGNESLAFTNETYRATIFGVTEHFAKIYDLYPAEGRIFGEDEIKSYANVVIIGFKVKDELFGNDEALDQKIKIKGRNFKVIGILPKKGQFSFLNFDETAIIPYLTAQQYIFGIKYFHRIAVEADTEANVAETVEDIKTTLRNSHNITDPEKDDFFIETQVEAMETVSSVTDILTMFLAAVAAISLLVGGVGIMNIMLVSVTERTREIGLRKAIGATEKNILLQFLLEAMILTVTGGVIGIILGTSFSFLVSFILSKVLALNWAFVFPIEGAFFGLVVAAGVGLIFGLYPARQASRKNPIDALRYE
ncbi:MAG: ABC transporter permease [Patescibacteria group bacterium]|nr:ABC transporter permease [Patescibacteria group bacterium]